MAALAALLMDHRRRADRTEGTEVSSLRADALQEDVAVDVDAGEGVAQESEKRFFAVTRSVDLAVWTQMLFMYTPLPAYAPVRSTQRPGAAEVDRLDS